MDISASQLYAPNSRFDPLEAIAIPPPTEPPVGRQAEHTSPVTKLPTTKLPAKTDGILSVYFLWPIPSRAGTATKRHDVWRFWLRCRGTLGAIMGTAKVIRLGRQELYERVWSFSITFVGRDYGISDTTLTKLFKRHKIPWPPIGYWAKLRGGKEVSRTPLPACSDPSLQTVEIRPKHPRPVKQAAKLDPEIVALIDKVRGLPPISVPATISDPHPLVEATRRALDRLRPDEHGLMDSMRSGKPVLDVNVGSGSVSRAMKVFDTLIKAVEQVGGRVEVRTDEPNGYRYTVAVFCGEAMALRLREQERYWQVPTLTKKWTHFSSAKVEHEPTGELILDRYTNDGDHVYGQDSTAAGQIEDQIGMVLLST